MLNEATYSAQDLARNSRANLTNGTIIDKAHLVNTLNFLNFSNNFVIVNFRHPVSGAGISYRARPSPCLNDTFDCTWYNSAYPSPLTSGYEFKDILVPAGRKLFLVNPHVLHIGNDHVRCCITQACVEVNTRGVKRNPCKNIQVRLSQKGVSFAGRLVDFSALAFRVEIRSDSPQGSPRPTPDSPIDTLLCDRENTLYSGKCHLIRHTPGDGSCFIALAPVHRQVALSNKKIFRNIRQALVPAPDIVFRHPFTGQKNTRKTIDVSGGGFAVEDDENRAVLLPGMLVPALELHFASGFKVKCKAKVVYTHRKRDSKDGERLKCGVAIIDMPPDDHAKLLSMLYQAQNSKAYIGNPVDLDSLWQFFFETGFIYPHKYGLMQKDKECIKQTYKRLYTETPEIARHFICQDKGHILGHVAMLRFYNHAWLIHHHAARKAGFAHAGVVVLNQIGRYINDAHRLFSMKMKYVFCYFRPENRFPARVFGGAARSIDDPQGCSLDTFSYSLFRNVATPQTKLAAPWALLKTDRNDLLTLKRHYQRSSNGLMLKAFNLEPETTHIGNLEAAYRQSGFLRTRYLVSLKRQKTLQAIFILNISDVGLNLSDLTNSVTVIVLDPENLPEERLKEALAYLIEAYVQKEVPVLVYPESYAEGAGISSEKTYTLWILNMQYTDQYFTFMHRMLGRFDNLQKPGKPH